LISADLDACPVTGDDLPSFRLAISWASWRPVFGSVFVTFSLMRSPKVRGISVVEKDWAEFVLDGVSDAGSCLSGFLLFWFCWGDSAFTVVRNVWLKSSLGLFIGSFWAIAGMLSAVVDSGVLEYGWILSAAGENLVLFVKVLGLVAGGGATAAAANIVLSIVIKFVFINKNLLKQYNSSNCRASISQVIYIEF
jgi:hypothetical protein